MFHSLLVLFGLAYCDPSSVSGCIHVMGFTLCQCQQALTSFPLPYEYVFLLRSAATSHYLRSFTHLLWMLWQTSTAEVITSHLSTPGKLYW